jgi:hypothetical protein
MSKVVAVVVGCLLVVGSSAMGAPNAADQKWLDTVQKMVENGQARISTPSQERVDLLKKWAIEKGYTLEVVKFEAGYRIGLTKTARSKSIAKN